MGMIETSLSGIRILTEQIISSEEGKGNQMNGTTRLIIEWRHLDQGEILCGRCTDTGTNLLNVIVQMGREHLLDGVEVEVKNTLLPPEKVHESNIVLINGIPLEKILDRDVTFAEQCCPDFIGKPAPCRVVTTERDVFEAVPAEVLRRAILKVLEHEKRR